MSVFHECRFSRLGWLLFLLTLLGLDCRADDLPTLNMCVYDPMGASGDFFIVARDYQLAARQWGVNLQLKAYPNDTLAAQDFDAGKCDVANIIGLRARLYNTFTGTIDAPGAVQDYAQMRTVLGLMNSPKLARFMVSGQYEVAGILPVGACYNFVHDRHLTTMARLVNKKIAILGWDKVEPILVEQFGAQPIPSDTAKFGDIFNNNKVDIIIAPIELYKPFELYKGTGEDGGIIRRPVLELSLQFIIRRDRFPAGFGSQSRDYMARQEDHAFSVIHNLENAVDQRQWVYMTTTEHNDFNRIVRDARARLAQNGFYDKRMLNILKRVRCSSSPGESECATGEE